MTTPNTQTVTTIDLYDVLNVPHDADKQTIKNAFSKLVKVYHPDKPNGNAELFELITHAYNILSNVSSRADYDQICKLSKDSIMDHEVMKSKSAAFYKALETSEIIKPKEVAMKEFNEEMDELKERMKPVKIETTDMTNLHNDLLLAREQDEIELSHEALFKDGKFDRVKFNEAFDMYFGNNNGAMTPYEDIESYASSGKDDFMEINYSVPISKPNITKSQVKNLDISSSKYNVGSQKLSESDFERLLREREEITLGYDNRTYTDFDTNVDKFGVFNNLGLPNSSLQWDNNTDDLKKKYQQLLESRRLN